MPGWNRFRGCANTAAQQSRTAKVFIVLNRIVNRRYCDGSKPLEYTAAIPIEMPIGDDEFNRDVVAKRLANLRRGPLLFPSSCRAFSFSKKYWCSISS